MWILRMLCIGLSASIVMCCCKGLPINKKQETNAEALKRVAVYQEGEYTGCQQVDFASHSISALRPALSESPKTWGYYRTRLLPADEARLRRLIDPTRQNLAGFHPESRWFKGMPPPDSGTVLVIEWEHTRVALAIPPQALRSRLGKSESLVYISVDEIACMMRQMTSQYAERSKIEEVPIGDKRIRDFYTQSDRANEASLPKHRVGW